MNSTATQAAKEGTPQEVLALLRAGNARLVSIFGSIGDDHAPRVNYIIDLYNREYRLFTCRTKSSIPSATQITPAAAWYERELHEQYGIAIEGHSDLRPLIAHPADYPFLQVQGEGVCEVPVGPVHAGIIEPGHFRFSVVGDTVLHLELHHFYTHKGTEKLFEGTSPRNGPIIAESVSGDHCFSHAVAYCQAVENAFDIRVPVRAEAIRLVGLELERMVAHIADVGALCGDVGFTVPAAYTARIKESLLQSSVQLIGTRFWRGVAIPGGVRCDISDASANELRRNVADAACDFADLARIILETPSVQNRFESTGVLKEEAARAFGVVGLAARASNVKLDVRCDHPYGHYRDLQVETPHFHYGDVLARARMRIEETAISARLVQDTLAALPRSTLSAAVPPNASGQAFSTVESPRGELLYWIAIRNGSIVRCHIKSPSFQNWPALPLAMPGNIIADFPLINKSFNLSYSGCDR